MIFNGLKWLPWVVVAVVLATIAVIWAIGRRKQAMQHLKGLKTSASPLRRKLANIALAIAFILSAIAVLRPTGGNIVSENRLPAKNVIILFDVSMSMAAADAGELTRMEAAKIFANEFVSRRPLDRIGMISFAGAAFPECPVTLDRTILQERINVQKPGGLPAGGTDLSVALEEAAALLTKDPPPGSSILLISDGDNILGDPLKTVEKFVERKIPIFVLALGEAGVPFDIPYKEVTTTADHDILGRIVNATNGQLFKALPEDMDPLLVQLDLRLDSIEFDGEDVVNQIYQRPLELYAYPLAAALCFLFVYFAIPVRTKQWHPLKSILLFGLLSTTTLQAVDFEDSLKQARSEDLSLLAIFTGSDWSETSIAFKREILDSSLYQEWAETRVIPLVIDLPRQGLDREERAKRRDLAARFDVVSYPVAIFIDREGEEMGRLNHSNDGPRKWIERADDILAGNKSASDTPGSIAFLPESVRRLLEDRTIDAEQRALRYYNHGVMLEREEPEMMLESEDRRDLLNELYGSASRYAPKDHPEIIAAAQNKMGLMNHRLARKALPLEGDTLEDIASRTLERPAKDPAKPFTNALKDCRKALRHYAQAVALVPGDKEMTENLSLLHYDIHRLQGFSNYIKARQTAVDSVLSSWRQETRFLKSLELGVTTSVPINDTDINGGVAAINDLIAKADIVKDQPTIITEKEIEDFGLAKEDMELAPKVHGNRKLGESEMHIKNALDHLIDLNNAQPMQGEGEPRGRGSEPGDRPEGEEEEEGDGQGRDSDQDLRRARKNRGSLRDRQLDRMGHRSRRVAPQDNH